MFTPKLHTTRPDQYHTQPFRNKNHAHAAAKYGGTHITSEHFNTAGRSVKTGLIAAVVCSQWTWAATLLQVRGWGWSMSSWLCSRI